MRVIDLFAGLGGNSEGARQAGCNVVWAANHWQSAVDIHAANHPGTTHICQDLHQADWTKVPEHDLLIASPACQGHSRARGKERPQHDIYRSTAWAVVSAVEYHRPPFVIVENVPEFAKWALYESWCSAMNALGYSINPMILNSADFGVPQSRNRLFIVCAKSQYPLDLKLPKFDHVPSSSIIDFQDGKWSPIDKEGRSAKTLSRIDAGRLAHGDRFLVAYYGNEKGGRSLSRPIGTITTHDRWAVIDGNRMRMLTVAENRKAMAFPDDYKLPSTHKDAVFMLGNAVPPPMTREVIKAMEIAA